MFYLVNNSSILWRLIVKVYLISFSFAITTAKQIKHVLTYSDMRPDNWKNKVDIVKIMTFINPTTVCHEINWLTYSTTDSYHNCYIYKQLTFISVR